MKVKCAYLVILFAVIVCIPSLLFATQKPSAPNLPPVVTTDWLAEHLQDADLVLLHIGRPGSYESGHLPGARKASLRRIIRVNDAGIRDEMLSTGDLGKALAELGIAEHSRIVVYFAEEGAAWAAARYVLTLEYAGMTGRAAYLDGGLPKWEGEKRPVSKNAASFETTNPALTAAPGVLVDSEWLHSRLDDPGIAIIDGRPAEGYSGREGHWDRLGHIPGAKNIPFFSVMADKPAYLLKSRDELAEMFRAAGAEPGDTVVVYCGTGLWASLPCLAARHLGYDARLYDGSFQEWSATKNLPVATADGSGKTGE